MLKTLRLCIDLGHRHFEKIAHCFEKIHHFFHRFFLSKIDEKSSPEVRKTPFARKIDKKTLPDTPFWAKDRFLVDFWVPEGAQKLLKIYGGF